MSAHTEESELDRRQAALRRAERRSRREEDPWDSSFRVAARRDMWKRPAGASFERLPDPTRHPECWFKFV